LELIFYAKVMLFGDILLFLQQKTIDIMKELTMKSTIKVCQLEELSKADQELLSVAIDSTTKSYAPYSHFCVGAAVRLANNCILPGCNQENAAFPSGLCAERSAIFAAGAQYPDQAVVALAIAARDTTGQLTEEPISPCGTCRQVIIETETRFKQPVRILLYGQSKVYVLEEGIKALMPLSFTEF
jgi:cytidine deaminase